MDDDAESIITNQRYAYISKVMDRCVKKRSAAHSLSGFGQDRPGGDQPHCGAAHFVGGHGGGVLDRHGAVRHTF